MKTTVNIPDSLFEDVRRLAHEEHTTIKDLVEEGLRRALHEHRRSKPFRLRRATFKGKGLQAPLAGASWERIREIAYEGRGG
jgi:hypothetical protein